MSYKMEVKDLDFYYSDFKALKNINLQIKEKDVVAFIGPSGCGKSTLLRTLNRINDTIEGTRVEGTVLLDGQDVYDKHFDVISLRSRVGMVFQKPNPFPMSIRDNIIYAPKLNGIRAKAKLHKYPENELHQKKIETYERKEEIKKVVRGVRSELRICKNIEDTMEYIKEKEALINNQVKNKAMGAKERG